MTTQPDTFFVKVIAVVIGGVLLIPVLAFLRWLGAPLRNWEIRELIRNRRKFLLVYQPYATPPASRMLTLLDDGEIGAGRNDNEYTWRVKRGCLEFFSEDGRLYSRFKIDRANGRLSSVVGRHVRAVWGQYLLPQY
jgi:hypothetical protein